MKYLLSFGLIITLAAPAFAWAGEVVVYSSRKEHLIKPLFDRFTADTGIKVTYLTDKAGPLIQRLVAEGKRTPADMLITVDAGNLWQAAERGILAKTKSKVLDKNVPSELRDPEGRWYGLSQRARTIIYSTERVNPKNISTYEGLGDPMWKGRLCLRTSKKVYNQSLVASFISHQGKDKAEKIVKSWVKNLTVAPFSNDNKLIAAIESGKCDIGIVNTYYFGRIQKKRPSVKLALAWPNQKSTGVHVNVSGAGVTKFAKNPKEAKQLLEFLSSEAAQGDFAGINQEFPVNPRVEPTDLVKAWGGFKADSMNLSEAGKLQADSVRLMDRAGYK